MTVLVHGPGAYPKPPYGSFAGKPLTFGDSKNFVQVFTVHGPGGYSKAPWGSFAGRVAVAPVAPEEGGRYSRIPLYRHRKKRLEEELEELAHQLRDIAIDTPLPRHSEPVIYDEPLFEAFSDKQKTINGLVSRRAKLQAEYQALLKRQQEDDDESAILLLWQ